MRNNHDPDVLSQALAEPSRRALLENLRLGEQTVSQLVEATGLKQPNVSNHLAKMRTQGIVRAERVGRQVHYTLSTPFAAEMLRMLEVVAHSTKETLPISDWREIYFQAMMKGDEDGAVALVNVLLAQRLPMETIYIAVFQWGINRIGELYQKGLTDEAHEHMASAITERMMARVAHFYAPVMRTPYRAVLGCVPGNWHAMGLRMLGDGLRNMGWDTVFLGANVPIPSFLTMVETMWPDMVVISCAMEEQMEATRELLAQLDGLRQSREAGTRHDGFLLVAGGHYIQEHAELISHLPIDFTASDLSQFLEEVHTRFGDRPQG